MQPPRSAFAVLTGIALIMLPVLGLVLKFFSFGWLTLMLFMGPILVLAAGYAVQIVIAAQGLFSRRVLFAGAARARAMSAAWLTSAGALLIGVFLPDTRDREGGSTFQVWLGAFGPNGEAVLAATSGVNAAVAMIAFVIWLGGFVWLFVEWLVGLTKRNRAEWAAARVPPPGAWQQPPAAW